MTHLAVRTDHGSATVEFALVIPIVLVVLVALVEVAVVARTQLELLGAAREGARVAATNPDPAAAVEAVQRALGEEVVDRVIVTVDRPAIVGREAVVRLSLTYRLLSALFGGVPLDMTARSVMRVER